MQRLTAEKIHGIWAGVTLCWDEQFGLDEATYARNVERTIAGKVHGIYTTGSTGEFYALDFEEFRLMVDIQAQLCGSAEMPLQIGCCSDNTRDTIRLLEYAASKGAVGAAQVCLPYWMELTDREVLQFFKDISQAVPDLPLVHYNVPRAKRFLDAGDYQNILEVAPNLIGVKYTFAGSNFGAFQDCLIKLPQLCFYVAENLLASGMLLGAGGCCSSLVSTNPAWMLQYYDHAQNGRWSEAIDMQKTATEVFEKAAMFIEERGEGAIDPVFDKGFGVAAGCVLGSQRTRAPYIGWSDETVKAMRDWLGQNYSQFLFQERS
ncbi:MAG: dihydrodipicolinate synthase family protein [Abditibacteriaceae bacterium]